MQRIPENHVPQGVFSPSQYARYDRLYGLSRVQRGLDFQKPVGAFVAIEKEWLDDLAKRLPRSVYAMLLFAKRRLWLRGHTFFRFQIAADYFGVTIRTVRRWMAELLKAGVLRRVKRTGRHDCFVLAVAVEKPVETAENTGNKDRSDRTKMSARIKKESYTEEPTKIVVAGDSVENAQPAQQEHAPASAPRATPPAPPSRIPLREQIRANRTSGLCAYLETIGLAIGRDSGFARLVKTRSNQNQSSSTDGGPPEDSA